MNSFELLAAWTGLLGGAGGVAALFLQFSALYRSAPRISVTLTFAIDPNTGKEYFSLDVINKGSMPITLGSVGIEYKNGYHSSFNLFPQMERRGENLPYRIDGYSSEHWLVGQNSTRIAIKDQETKYFIRAYANLRTGRLKRSKWVKISEVIS